VCRGEVVKGANLHVQLFGVRYGGTGHRRERIYHKKLICTRPISLRDYPLSDELSSSISYKTAVGDLFIFVSNLRGTP
jgi:hypothetical protein